MEFARGAWTQIVCRMEIKMKLRNVLIVVKDIEQSKKYYHDLFGLEMLLDNGGNMILSEGLVLQEEECWKDFLQGDVLPRNNHSELYFEEAEIESFVDKLERLYPETEYVNPLTTHSWGQKVVRFYDLDIDYAACRGKNIFWNKIRRIIYTKRHQRRLEEILLKEKPDITISMMTGREREWLYRLKDGSKKILECHFSYFSYQNVKGIINRYKIKRFLNKIKYYDRLVVLTEEDRKDWGRKDNIVVIPNALTFYPKESADLSIPRVIAVGRLSAQKGFDRLIAIWAEIEPYFPDWKLTIIGSGELQDTLERQIGLLKLKSVEICPPRAEIIREYLGSSVYVLTSRHEGFPMVLHEAMACGLPVVAYTCKCGPRDIIQDRQDGFLIEEGDENEFVKRLSQLMADSSLRQKVGNEARRNIIRFALPSVMKKWENLFITLASQDE